MCGTPSWRGNALAVFGSAHPWLRDATRLSRPKRQPSQRHFDSRKLLPTLAVYTMQCPAELHICHLVVHNPIPELPVAPRLPPSLICLSTLTRRPVTTLVESVDSDVSRGTSNTIVDRGPTLPSHEVTRPLSPKSSNGRPEQCLHQAQRAPPPPRHRDLLSGTTHCQEPHRQRAEKTPMVQPARRKAGRSRERLSTTTIGVRRLAAA